MRTFTVLIFALTFSFYVEAQVTLRMDQVETFRHGEVWSGVVGPCLAVFIYDFKSKTLVASHISSFAWDADHWMILDQFARAQKLFDLKEAYLFVTGVSGPLDSLLERRRGYLKEAADLYEIPESHRWIRWTSDDHFGQMKMAVKKGTIQYIEGRRFSNEPDSEILSLSVSQKGCKQLLSSEK